MSEKPEENSKPKKYYKVPEDEYINFKVWERLAKQQKEEQEQQKQKQQEQQNKEPEPETEEDAGILI